MGPYSLLTTVVGYTFCSGIELQTVRTQKVAHRRVSTAHSPRVRSLCNPCVALLSANMTGVQSTSCFVLTFLCFHMSANGFPKPPRSEPWPYQLPQLIGTNCARFSSDEEQQSINAVFNQSVVANI